MENNPTKTKLEMAPTPAGVPKRIGRPVGSKNKVRIKKTLHDDDVTNTDKNIKIVSSTIATAPTIFAPKITPNQIPQQVSRKLSDTIGVTGKQEEISPTIKNPIPLDQRKEKSKVGSIRTSENK